MAGSALKVAGLLTAVAFVAAGAEGNTSSTLDDLPWCYGDDDGFEVCGSSVFDGGGSPARQNPYILVGIFTSTFVRSGGPADYLSVETMVEGDEPWQSWLLFDDCTQNCNNVADDESVMAYCPDDPERGSNAALTAVGLHDAVWDDEEEDRGEWPKWLQVQSFDQYHCSGNGQP